MKLLAAFIFLFAQQMTATVYSQVGKVTLKLEKASFQEVVRALEQVTDYTFLYRDEQVNKINDLNLKYKNADLKEVLDRSLQGSGLTYRVVDKTIVIVPAEAAPADVQQIVITGQVVDESGNSLPGVTVKLKGVNLGTATDMEGRFQLTLPDVKHPVLVFSFVGMKTKEVSVTAGQALKVVLEPDVTEMEEVVVTGIFNKAKESYTGAVTTISSKELKMYRGQNLLATLKNIDPSINIIANNSLGSNPNVLPEINIRGNASLPMSVSELNENAAGQLNAPLVIMDGFEVPLEKLMDFNDEEIESINILKDASATAIYGSRGADGIIVITTKAPQAGKMKIFAQAGINIEIPDLSSYNLLNARGKLALEKEVGLYDGEEGDPTGDRRLKEEYNARLAEVLGGVDTYWLSQPLRTGVGQRYNLRLEGGSDQFRWSTSLSYNTVEGAMKGSSRKNFSGAVILSYTYKNILFKNQTVLDYNNSANSKYGDFADYAMMNPYWKIKDENGEYIKTYQTVGRGGTKGNPLWDAQLNIIDKSKYNQMINNFSIEWNAMEALKLRAQIGILKKSLSSDYFLPAEHSSFEKDEYMKDKNFFRKGMYNYSTGEATNVEGNVTLSYSKMFADKHQLYVGLNYTIRQEKSTNYSFRAEGFANQDVHFWGNALQYAEDSKPSGSEGLSRSIGFTGNLNYTYDSRYYVDVSYRVDGSSPFGTKNKFAPFWSGGIGWNLHKEKFLKDSRVINLLRLRGSYGETGTQNFSPYQALSTFQYYTDKKYLIWSGAGLMGLGNEKLKWQKTDELNGGIELELWGKRVTASLDVYQKKTSNLLSQMELPLAHGFSSYTANVGKVKNYGFEAVLGGYIIRNTSRNLIWMMTAKLAYNKNKITKLSQALKDQTELYIKQDAEFTHLLYEGRSQYAIYAVPSLGIDPSTGKEIFLDKNGNVTNTWRSSNKRYFGDSEPKYRGNISTMFSYKDLTLNLSFGYHWGGQQYNETLLNKVEVTTGAIQYNVDKRVWSDRWQKPGDVKLFKGYDEEPTKATSRFVMDDNVFELQSASLQYRWHSDFLRQRFSIESLNFNLNMSDVFYISSIKRERGTNYPFARRVDLAVSIMF